MHSPVTQSGDGIALEDTTGRLVQLERVTRERVFLDDKQGQAPCAGARIGVRTGQQGNDVRPTSKRAPGLGAVEDKALFATHRGRLGPALHRGDIRPSVRLGHRDGHHELTCGDRWQPFLLLCLAPAAQERLDENLRPGNQATGHAQRGGGQFLGGDNHRQVAHTAAAVLLGRGHAEVA